MSEDLHTLGPADEFLRAEVCWHEAPTARIAYRKFGQGPPLVMLHGWPLWGFTFRNVIPHLRGHFTCYVFDLPSGGDTEWQDETDFSWPGQAASVKSLIDELGLERYALLGQNSGGMIARHLCELDGSRVRALIMTNPEVPGHRPPYIPSYRRLMALPGSSLLFRLCLSNGWFLRSQLGFGGSMLPERIDGEFRDHIIRALVRSSQRMRGHIRFLRGWDWGLLDQWAQRHRQLSMPVLLVWGVEDRVFPIELGKMMAGQFDPPATVQEVQSRLFVQEEQPEELASAIIHGDSG